MKVLIPITMTDAQLTSSNVAEDDHAEWDISTTYDTGDLVISITTHSIYESVIDSNLGNDPATDDGTNWLTVSATNRWKAFDLKIADQVTNSGTVEYVITPASKVTGLAFFGLSAASVRVQVDDDSSPATEVYDETINLVDDSNIFDWFTFFTEELDEFQTEALFANVPAFPGYSVTITVGDGAGTAKVGEVALGKVVTLGETLEGSSLGLRSFSTREQDTFGNWNIVPRPKSEPVDFLFSMSGGDSGRVRRVLSSLVDTPAVYFADETLASYGATVFGFFQDYELPLRYAGKSTVTLEIEALT